MGIFTETQELFSETQPTVQKIPFSTGGIAMFQDTAITIVAFRLIKALIELHIVILIILKDPYHILKESNPMITALNK